MKIKQIALISLLVMSLILVVGSTFGQTLERVPSLQTENSEINLAPVSTAFTYQGQLQSSGALANGNFGFEFRLYDAVTAGIQIGPTQAMTVTVTDGLFTVELDFGDVYDGNALWLDLTVESTTLTPRQPLTAAPFAHYALDGPDADATNEYNTGVSFDGTNLTVTDAGTSFSADISALEDDADPDPANEYNTGVSFDGTNLTVTDAGTSFSADISALEDDADPDPANEYNTGVSFDGTNLTVTDAGTSFSADISSLASDSDWAYNAGSGLTGDIYHTGNVSVGTTSANEQLSVQGNILVRDAQNNGAIILSPSSNGYGVDPELVIQSAETSTGNDAPFHISRNAIYTTATDNYLYIDDSGDEASKIEFQNNGDIMFSYADALTGTVTFTNNVFIDGDMGYMGIGTTSPISRLDVDGQITMRDGAATGYIPVADANGTMTWTDPATITSMDDGDWSISGDNLRTVVTGNVGININNPLWRLTIHEEADAMLDSETIETANLAMLLNRGLNQNNTGIGIGFQSTTTSNIVGAAIVHERVNNNSQGSLHFATKPTTSNSDTTLPIRMTINDQGNVGIGTVTPSALLQVSGTVDIDVTAVIGNMAVGAESTAQASSNSSSTGFTTTPWLYTNAIEAQGERGVNSTLITIGADGTFGVADEIHFVTNGADYMAINSNGNVDIKRGNDISILTRSLTVGGARNGNGTAYAQLNFNNYDDNAGVVDYTGARIASFNETSADSGNLSFQVNSGTGLSEEMLIATTGFVGLGTTPEADLHIKQSNGTAAGTGGLVFERISPSLDTWKIYHSGTHLSFAEGVGGVSAGVRQAYIEGGTGAYVQTSDAERKTNVTDLDSVLSDVMLLRPVQYLFANQSPDAPQSTGFIAQEVGAVFPELMRTDEEGQHGLAYSDFAVLAIAAIQEQQAIIDSQAADIEQLQAEYEEVKARLYTIEAYLATEKNQNSSFGFPINLLGLGLLGLWGLRREGKKSS